MKDTEKEILEVLFYLMSCHRIDTLLGLKGISSKTDKTASNTIPAGDLSKLSPCFRSY